MPEGVGEAAASQAELPKIEAPKIEAPKIEPPQFEPPQFEPPQFEPPPFEPPQFEVPKISPPSLADVNFDDLLPPESEPEPEPQAPAFPIPPSMSELSFDAPQAAPKAAPSAEPESAGSAPGFPASPITGPSGMGISISGPGAQQAASGPTPAQLAATAQALRIRLLRPDGKPFDGPEITTGPKSTDSADSADLAKPAADQSRNGYDGAPRGPKKQTSKQAPKVVVKAGPLERLGHALAVLAISAIGIVPLAYLLLQSVHDREDELAAKITVPTKMNVLDGTADAYLGAMAVVLLVVALVYRMRLKRRRMR
jgi:hypothetical protein